jgi:zinc protease
MKAFVVSLALAAACGGTRTNGEEEPVKQQETHEQVERAAGPAPHFAEGNGELVSLPIAGASGVAFRILFYTGSADDPAGKEGLTLLTATSMAEGGTAQMTYPEILRALYPMAASIDVQVDKEQTVFSGLVHPDHVKDFVPILTAVVKSPRLEAADFERVKQNMLNDITKRLRATDDENFGKELLGQMLYQGDHPYRHYVGGTVKGLSSITLDDVKAHREKVFGRRRLLIGVGGAITPETAETVKAALADLPEGSPRIAEIAAPRVPQRTEVLIADKPSSQAVAISIGYPHFLLRGHEDWAALALLASYFGEHRQFHGKLMMEIREKRGMNYGDYSYVESFVQEGYSRFARTNIARRRQHFEIWLRPVQPSEAVFAVRMALLLLDRLVREGVTQEDVAGTKQFLDGYTRLWEMSPMRRLGYALDDQFYGTKNYLETLRAQMAGVDAERVNRALRAHLVAGPVKIAIVAPNAQVLMEALVSDVPTPKSYDVEKPEPVKLLDEEAAKFPLKLSADQVRIVAADQAFEE